MNLYDWQKKGLELWERNNYRGIANVVTGAGKTIFSLAAIDLLLSKHPDLRIKIIVPTIPLAEQWINNLYHHVKDYHLYPGLVGNGIRTDPKQRTMVYIINSARDTLSSHIKREFSLRHPVFLICDECHHYQSPQNRKIFDFLNDDLNDGSKSKASIRKSLSESLYYCLGLSATPFGTQNDDVLIKYLGPEILHYGFDNSQKDGILAPFYIGEISASFLEEELSEYQDLSNRISIILGRIHKAHPELKALNEKAFFSIISKQARAANMDPSNLFASFLLLTYQRRKLTNLAKTRLLCCLSLLEQLRETDRIFIFCERISQAEELVFAIRRKFGNVCGIYHSEQSKDARKRLMNSFRNHEFRILVSCRCLDEGLDVPDANIGIVLSSSSEDRQRIQRLGRILRKSPDKLSACLYYIYIRESSDNPSYLSELPESRSFSLRYYAEDNLFSNETYEYLAANLLRITRNEVNESSSFDEYNLASRRLSEMKKCLDEGIVRPDYLLSKDLLKKLMISSKSRHEKNYWKVQTLISKNFLI